MTAHYRSGAGDAAAGFVINCHRDDEQVEFPYNPASFCRKKGP
jgi:hypothetical protein